jgi:alkylation response protein AidB-like acyl-CoA dehydrogenase
MPVPQLAAASAEFQQEVRSWIRARLPLPPLPVDEDARHAYLRSWQRELFDAGLVAVSFPVAYGGRGLNPVFDALLLEELGAAGAPSAFHYGYIARVLLEFGTEKQRERYIRRALSGDEEWCQGFSEPDAGSDLGSVRTKAEIRGTELVITGQKVWTSRAHHAHRCLLLVRTGAPDSRHRGLSCVILPMEAQGLTVRPFRQMTGALEFAELFLDEVRVPVENVVGGIGGGWQVAMATVSYERGPSDIGKIADLRGRLLRVTTAIRDRGPRPHDPIPMELAEVYVALEVLNAHVHRSLWDREGGRGGRSSTSVDKLLMSEADQLLARLEMHVSGADVVVGRESATAFDYLEARAATIYGGTTQIQRHIVATSVLELPKG